MPAFVIFNRTPSDIQLIIPAPSNVNRSSFSVVVHPAQSIDILPYAGSLDNCGRIASIRDMQLRNYISINVIN